MEQMEKSEDYIRILEEQDQAVAEELMRTDAEIAKGIAEQQISRRISQEIVKTESVRNTGTVSRQISKDTVKKATNVAVKKAAQTMAKETGKEAVKKSTQAVVGEVTKDTASFIFASSGTAISTAGGAAAGIAGGLPGVAIGMAVGSTVGKASDLGMNTVFRGFDRRRQIKKAMIDAFRRGENPKTISHMLQMAGGEFISTIRNLGILKSMFPGLKSFLIISTVCIGIIAMICMSMVISILLMIAVIQNAFWSCVQDSLGQLAGGQEVVYYCQYEEPWADYAYGDSTISVCGCGPTTMAIVVSTLTNQTITPIDAAEYATEHGFYFNRVGTMWSYFVRGAEGYGLTSVNHGDDLMTALECIPEGGMVVITVGKSDGTGNELYRGNGHFMAIRGITEEGKILVADPASRSNSEMEWDYQTVTEILKNCWSITYEVSEEPELPE